MHFCNQQKREGESEGWSEGGKKGGRRIGREGEREEGGEGEREREEWWYFSPLYNGTTNVYNTRKQ